MNNQANWLPFSDSALHAVVLGLVIASWVAFVVVFMLRRKPPGEGTTESKRESRSLLGVALQGLSYGIVWGFMRAKFTHPAAFGATLDLIVAMLTVAVAFASVWLVTASIRTLGKQWSLAARVVEGHKLIVEGPYAWVRHPIYTGMFGMLLATGLAVSLWPALVVSIVVFWVGTVIRVRSEERLLRTMFGAGYEDYARRVNAVVPGIY